MGPVQPDPAQVLQRSDVVIAAEGQLQGPGTQARGGGRIGPRASVDLLDEVIPVVPGSETSTAVRFAFSLLKATLSETFGVPEIRTSDVSGLDT